MGLSIIYYASATACNNQTGIDLELLEYLSTIEAAPRHVTRATRNEVRLIDIRFVFNRSKFGQLQYVEN